MATVLYIIAGCLIWLVLDFIAWAIVAGGSSMEHWQDEIREERMKTK